MYTENSGAISPGWHASMHIPLGTYLFVKPSPLSRLFIVSLLAIQKKNQTSCPPRAGKQLQALSSWK